MFFFNTTENLMYLVLETYFFTSASSFQKSFLFCMYVSPSVATLLTIACNI